MQEQLPSTRTPLSFWLPWIQAMWCRPPPSLSSVRLVLQSIVITFSEILREDKQRWSLMGALFCPQSFSGGGLYLNGSWLLWSVKREWVTLVYGSYEHVPILYGVVTLFKANGYCIL